MFSILVALSINLSFANPSTVSIKNVEALQTKLSQLFKQEIEIQGFKELQIIVDDQIPSYIGGVQIKEDKITIAVGRDALFHYSIETFRFLVCHELGHHLGGAPYKSGFAYKDLKISTEGQSDYWAALECLPKLSADPLGDAKKFFDMMLEYLQPLSIEGDFYTSPKLSVQETRFFDSEYMSFQCRMNTIEAGVNKRARPSCWYRK